MPGNNDFLAFGIAAGAPVESQSTYAGYAANGRGAGIVPKESYNKSLRQATSMAAAIGMFISAAGQNANDDGNIPALYAAFAASFGGVGGYLKPADFEGAHQHLAASGWQDLPGGLIIQWAHGTVSGGGSTTVTWPKAFPNALFGAVVSPFNSGLPNTPPTVTSSNLTQCVIDCSSGSDQPPCFIIALGY